MSRHYGRGDFEVAAVETVNLEVGDGEFVAIMGPSGSGKSTLLNLVGALDRPTSGRVLAAGRDISGLGAKDAARYRRREVGFVFQSFNLLPRFNVLENIAMPLVFEGIAPAERLRRAEALVERFGLTERARHKPATLSGGEKQRVAIARALVNEPRVLLADEPTGNLDSRNAELVIETLVSLNQLHSQTILLITHETEVAGAAGRTVRMRDGRIVES
ncbi:MAG: ABC transporter ATP-binding protein [Candidatus Dormiibacterota bacterium]